MDGFGTGDDLSGKVFADANLRGSRFLECDLIGAAIRGSDISGMEIDAPWLRFGRPLIVNGADVGPFVEAELAQRFPGRGLQESRDRRAPVGAYFASVTHEQLDATRDLDLIEAEDA